MTEIGYALSSEEHPANDLVQYARRAEEAGFTFALISDHYHPWIDKQGQSPFAWAVIGAISQVTQRLRLGTGVTCPTLRYHPAIIAQAAATAATMMPGRFFLGVGTGENLNEHIVGEGFPSYAIRLEMLEEAVDVIRTLWEGGLQSYDGLYYTVENAQIFSLPDEPPPLFVAAAGSESAETAGRIGDGLISTAPKAELIQQFDQGRQEARPHIGQLTVCWAKTEQEARRTAYEWWPNAAIHGAVSEELPLPKHFEQACQNVREDDVAEEIICSPDPQRHIQAIQKFVDAGFDQVYVHQVGPDQEGFFQFYKSQVIKKFS